MEGIAAAVKRGQHMGRPRIGYPQDFAAVYKRWQSGVITAVQAMRELSLKPNTFYRLVNEYGANKRVTGTHERSKSNEHGRKSNVPTGRE